MKKITLLIAFLLCSVTVFAQKLPAFENYPLKEDADFEAAESIALQAADFMLSVPLHDRIEDKKKAMNFLMSWMDGTPYYKFVIDATFELLAEDDNAFMGIYLAAQVKFMIENGIMSSDISVVKTGMWKLIATYIEDPAHKVTLSPNLAELCSANKNGTLAEFLERYEEE